MPPSTRLALIIKTLLGRLSEEERDGRSPAGFIMNAQDEFIQPAHYEKAGTDERPEFVKAGERGWKR